MRTILIIEDDHQTAVNLAGFLESGGYKAVSVEDGMEGLTMIKFLKPDVVIVDLMLPGMDGLDLIRRIRENVYLKNKMVLVISGTFTRVYTGGRVAGMDADAVFSKPFSMKKIPPVIERFFTPKARRKGGAEKRGRRVTRR